MIVYCKACNAGFHLEEKMLKKTGSKVRCSSCNAVFLAYPTLKTPEDLAKDMGIDMRGFNSEDPHAQPFNGITKDAEEGFKDITLDLDKQLDDDEIEEIDFSEDSEDGPKLDLSDIEGMLESADKSSLLEASEENPEDITLELDMDLDTDESEDTDVTFGASDDSSDLDMSEIEDMLEIKDDSDLPESLEEEKEDLILELDGDINEFADEKIDDTSELDLSDLEDMLEINDDLDLPESLEEELEEEKEDLILELDGDINEFTDEKIDDTSELDLSDLEDMLEINDDLDLPESSSEEEKEDLSLELDGEFNDDIETEADGLESDIEDIPLEDMSVEGDVDKDLVEVTVGRDASMNESVDAVKLDTTRSTVKKEKTKRPVRKTNRFFMALFILILLGGGLYGGAFLLEKQGIKVPYLTETRNLVPFDVQHFFQKAKQNPFTEALFGKNVQQDPDGLLNLYPIANSIQGMYIENSTTGTLYVITGEVQNNYNHPRSFIRVKANIFKKGEADSIMSKTVFCGNILSNLELENLNLNAIDLRLQNKEGYNQSNKDIKSGKTAPFMVVFENLPEDMEMFNIQPAGSFP